MIQAEAFLLKLINLNKLIVKAFTGNRSVICNVLINAIFRLFIYFLFLVSLLSKSLLKETEQN